MAIQALRTIDNDHSSLGSSSYLFQEFFAWIRTIPTAVGFKNYTFYRGLQKSMHLIWRGGKGHQTEYTATTFLIMLNLWEAVSKLKSWGVTIPMKAIEQYFHVVLFIMLYKVVLTFKSVNEPLVCDHSNESCWAVLSCGTVYCAVQGGSNV